jgi:hypothetical protein
MTKKLTTAGGIAVVFAASMTIAGGAQAASPLSLDELKTCVAIYSFLSLGVPVQDQAAVDHSAWLFRQKATVAAGEGADEAEIDKGILGQLDQLIADINKEGADKRAVFAGYQKTADDCKVRYPDTKGPDANG